MIAKRNLLCVKAKNRLELGQILLYEPYKNILMNFKELCKKALIFGGNYFADILPQSRHWIVWDKLNTMPTFGDCELIWTNIKRNSVKKITYQYNGLLGKEKERYHPTQKPVKLIKELIEKYSDENDLVLDPFIGSGTTAVACKDLGRKCIGIEISEEYVKIAIKRLSQEVLKFGVSCQI